ncbi:MAG: endo-1,4-beta-xylanase [Polyangiaceae bacterium]
MTDSPFQPLPGAPLRELAARRGIRIGTALDHALLDGASPYVAVAAGQFNSVTTENALKWDHTEYPKGVLSWERADRIVSFARAHDQRVRGHALVWHRQNPAWVSEDEQSPAELRALIRDRIAVTVGRYAGSIACWDVVNEPLEWDGSYRESLWHKALGPGYVAEALHWARQADPAAKLYINDYEVESLCPKSDALYALAKQLLLNGVPLDGIGFQAHLVLGRIPTDLEANLRRFADLGLDVAITELDIRVHLPADEARLAQQAEEYASVVRTCLRVPRCQELTLWGFTDALSWIPAEYPEYGAAAILDDGYAPKPAYHAVASVLGETEGRRPGRP